MRVMLLAMLLTGCQNINYIEKPYVPPISFPTFPKLKDYEYTRNPDDTVTVDGKYIIKLQDYGVYIEETEKTYNDLRELYNRRIRNE